MKAIVDGDIAWDQHHFTITPDGNIRRIEGNNLPDHTTGVYPIAANDDAYQYDRNPNSIGEQSLTFELPALPTVAAQPGCLMPGAIGVLLSGVVIFDALDALDRDAVAHETQDHCHGHPEVSGAYHYHSITDCLGDEGEGHSALVGYALDGFGIYGVRGEDSHPLTNADLDECHGQTHLIEWDGQMVELYHYHATYEYPYTLGCFKGEPVSAGVGAGGVSGGQHPGSGQPSQPGGNGQQPPPGANSQPPPPPGG